MSLSSYPSDEFQRAVEKCMVTAAKFEDSMERLRTDAGTSAAAVQKLIEALRETGEEPRRAGASE